MFNLDAETLTTIFYTSLSAVVTLTIVLIVYIRLYLKTKNEKTQIIKEMSYILNSYTDAPIKSEELPDLNIAVDIPDVDDNLVTKVFKELVKLRDSTVKSNKKNQELMTLNAKTKKQKEKSEGIRRELGLKMKNLLKECINDEENEEVESANESNYVQLARFIFNTLIIKHESEIKEKNEEINNLRQKSIDLARKYDESTDEIKNLKVESARFEAIIKALTESLVPENIIDFLKTKANMINRGHLNDSVALKNTQESVKMFLESNAEDLEKFAKELIAQQKQHKPEESVA